MTIRGPGPCGEGDLLIEARNLRVERQGNVHPPALARPPPSENILEPRVPSSSGGSSTTGPPSPFGQLTRPAGHNTDASSSSHDARITQTPPPLTTNDNSRTELVFLPRGHRILWEPRNRDLTLLRVAGGIGSNQGLGGKPGPLCRILPPNCHLAVGNQGL